MQKVTFHNLLLFAVSCIIHSLSFVHWVFQENYTAPRMVLAASGVEHEELLSYAEPLLSDLPKVPAPEVPKSVYVGGDYRCQADSPVSTKNYVSFISLFILFYIEIIISSFTICIVLHMILFTIFSLSKSRALMLPWLLKFLVVGLRRKKLWH